MKLLSSLRFIQLVDAFMDDNGWGSLLPYLTHQTPGGQAISLKISGGPVHIWWKILEFRRGIRPRFDPGGRISVWNLYKGGEYWKREDDAD